MNTPPQEYENHYTETNGLRLHHLLWPEDDQSSEQSIKRSTLVMLHGVRLHAHCWSDFARRTKGAYRVLALDARGHGDSDWCPENGYHLHSYYEDLRAVLQAHGNEKVTLIGHSLGARTAMLYTHLHPEQVEKLVLVDMGAGLPQPIGKQDYSRVTETAPPQDFASHQEAIDYLANILKRAPRDMIEESVVFGMRQREDGRYIWKYDPALSGPPQPQPGTREWDLWEVVKTIQCPTLLLHGEHSLVVSPEIAQRMQEDMANCEVEMVANAGHALFTDQPVVFSERVLDFLRKA